MCYNECIVILQSTPVFNSEKEKTEKQIDILLRHPEYKACFTWDKQLVEDDKLFECYGAGSLRFVWKKGLL